MKRIFAILSAALAFAACSKLGPDSSNPGTDIPLGPSEVVIGVSSGDDTKTVLSDSHILWQEGDVLKIFSDQNTTGEEFVSFGELPSQSAYFRGTSVSGTNFYAVYPSEDVTFDGNVISLTLPSEQEYVPGSFGNGCNPMLGKGTSLTTFSMKNLCGFIKLSLKGTSNLVQLRLTLDKAISGLGTVSVSGDTPVLVIPSSESKSVTLLCASGVQLSTTTATDFYFVVPQGSYNSIEINATDVSGVTTGMSSETAFAVNRSKIKKFNATEQAPGKPGRLEMLTEVDVDDLANDRERTVLDVFSFNVKCQTDDDEATDEKHKWTYRKTGVYAFFNEAQPGIIGTQECEYRQRVEILDNVSGYAAYGLGSEGGKEQATGSYTHYETVIGSITRPVSKSNNLDASNAILYLTSKYAVLDKGTFWLVSGAPSSPDKFSDSKHHRCCSWIKFQDKSTSDVFYVFNTHLDNGEYTVRQKQLDVLYSKMCDINTENLPMVMMGDLNETTTGHYLETFMNSGKLLFARNEWNQEWVNSYNAWSPTGGSRYDHIAYKNVYSLAGFKTYNTPYGGITYISDHYPIGASFKLNFQN